LGGFFLEPQMAKIDRIVNVAISLNTTAIK